MTKPPDNPPCRLYAILARDAPVGVVFRRGPTRRVQIIRWDTATDTFTPGQWFHGRIYERRCDLSPSGKLLIYFAQKLNNRQLESDYTYAWTAISRPPYLTALALWPQGYCWAGGGLFLSNRELWLNHREGGDIPHPDHKPKGLQITTDGGGTGEDEPILLRRLERDGWRQTQEMQVEFKKSDFRFVTHAPRILRKQNPLGWQKLTLTSSISEFKSRDEYVVQYAEGKALPLLDAAWADWDQRGRLVFASAGKIFALPADAIGQDDPRELIDLNGNTPEPMIAPDWAKIW